MAKSFSHKVVNKKTTPKTLYDLYLNKLQGVFKEQKNKLKSKLKSVTCDAKS